MDYLPYITKKRIKNSLTFDFELAKIKEVTIPPRDLDHVQQVFHIYSLRYERRDELMKFLQDNGVDAKIHYPVPMHLQPAAKGYGYKVGDFPLAETIADSTLSLPVHEFITKDQIDKVVSLIRKFYK